MPIPTSSWVTFAMLGGMSQAERDIAGDSLLLTALPGPAATRSMVATVAISQQASASIAREKQVAAATIRAIKDVHDNAVEPSKAFAKQSALRNLVPGSIANQFERALPGLVTPVVTPTGQTPAAQVQAGQTPAAQVQAGQAAAQPTGQAQQPAQQAVQAPAAISPANAPTVDPAVVTLAGQMVEKALAKTKNQTFTAKEAAEFQAFIDLLDPQTQAKLIKN